MKKSKILVTCPPMIAQIKNYHSFFDKYKMKFEFPEIKQTLDKKKLIKMLPDYDGWIAGDDETNYQILNTAKQGNLKAIIKWGVGTDNFDLNVVKKLGIKFSNIPNVFGNEVANVAISYLLGLATNTFFIDRKIRQQKWPKPSGIILNNKTLGVVGFGDIGKNICKRAHAFGLKVLVWDKYKKKPKNTKINFIKKWPYKIDKCDFVIIACSLNKENYRFFNKTIFKRMKIGSHLINVSRGDLVEEKDLIKYMKKKIIKGFASDVFNNEPIKANSYFKKNDNCILGSHNSSNVIEKVDEVSILAIKKLSFFLKKKYD
jgi:D-3-phosphoglycerate dehydrogenase|tara:strand:+ start:212 stop:1159 length:948 start_codon:yes stop_codon:yes gene_type:complete